MGARGRARAKSRSKCIAGSRARGRAKAKGSAKSTASSRCKYRAIEIHRGVRDRVSGSAMSKKR